MKNEIVNVLIERDNYSIDEAVDAVIAATEELRQLDFDVDIDDFIAEWFGLEPDYLFDLLWTTRQLEALRKEMSC